jgi:hypothetical protein
LEILNGLAPDRVAFPLLAAPYRAVLGGCDFSEHLAGPTGNFKTELATLIGQHHGAGLDARNLPGNWGSTGNALEAIAHAAADAVLVVDDFAPHGSASEVQRYHREADRLLRAQGNRSGRQRMRADGSLRPAKPPRGLILSTGEDVPRGQSLRARLFVLDIGPGEVNRERLTACQRNAAAGLYAQALAGYARWLAPQYAVVRSRLREERDHLRDRALADGMHARTPAMIADLALGLRYLLDFAVDAGAITATERELLSQRGWRAILDAAAAQVKDLEAAEPCQFFIRLLSAAIASGRAHVAGPSGDKPVDPAAWGWREEEFPGRAGLQSRWQSQGRRIGWVDGPDLYLEPEAAHAEAQRLASEQGESLPVSARTLRRRLHEGGWLASTDVGRMVLTVRRTLEGKRRDVIHLLEGLLQCTRSDQPDQTRQSAEVNGQVCGQAGD